MTMKTSRFGQTGRFCTPAIVMQMLSAPVLAQSPQLPPAVNPDAINAETLRRQQELNRAQPAPAAPEVTVAPRADQPKADGAALRFRLTAVRFPDSAYLSAAELAAIAQPYIGREVGFEELRLIVAEVNKRYDAIGVVTARATLPPQTIENGIVSVALVEGRIGDTRVEGGSPEGQAIVKRRVAVPSGELADISAIETQLVRFNRAGDAQLRATVVPGKAFGQTDLVLSLFEPKRRHVRRQQRVRNHRPLAGWGGGACAPAAHRRRPADGERHPVGRCANRCCCL
jgi:hemolysin activation/secretion protein